jgi:hypothetical protein
MDGFSLWKRSKALNTEKVIKTAKRVMVAEAPKVVLKRFSPCQVSSMGWPKRSNYLKLLEHYLRMFSCASIRSFMTCVEFFDLFSFINFFRAFLDTTRVLFPSAICFSYSFSVSIILLLSSVSLSQYSVCCSCPPF